MPPSLRSRSAPCTPATAPSDTAVSRSPSALLPSLPHTPPASSPQALLPAPPPSPSALRHTRSILLPPHPARSGIPGSSPDGPRVPETPGSHLAYTALGLPSDTSVLPPPRSMDPAQTSPPSAPLSPSSRAPLPLLRCTALPALPPAPTARSCPPHTS